MHVYVARHAALVTSATLRQPPPLIAITMATLPDNDDSSEQYLQMVLDEMTACPGFQQAPFEAAIRALLLEWRFNVDHTGARALVKAGDVVLNNVHVAIPLAAALKKLTVVPWSVTYTVRECGTFLNEAAQVAQLCFEHGTGHRSRSESPAATGSGSPLQELLVACFEVLSYSASRNWECEFHNFCLAVMKIGPALQDAVRRGQLVLACPRVDAFVVAIFNSFDHVSVTPNELQRRQAVLSTTLSFVGRLLAWIPDWAPTLGACGVLVPLCQIISAGSASADREKGFLTDVAAVVLYNLVKQDQTKKNVAQLLKDTAVQQSTFDSIISAICDSRRPASTLKNLFGVTIFLVQAASVNYSVLENSLKMRSDAFAKALERRDFCEITANMIRFLLARFKEKFSVVGGRDAGRGAEVQPAAAIVTLPGQMVTHPEHSKSGIPAQIVFKNNCCYIASVLFAVFAPPVLQLVADKHNSVGCRVLTCSLCLLNTFRTAGRSDRMFVVFPQHLPVKLQHSHLTKNFRDSFLAAEQMDALDYFSAFFDELVFPSQLRNQLFRTYNSLVLTCQNGNCGQKTHRQQFEFEFPVRIQLTATHTQAVSIAVALGTHRDDTGHDETDDDYLCQHCKARSAQDRQQSLFNDGPLLGIHIDRGYTFQSIGMKSRCAVTFDHEFSFKNVVYDLYAVISHRGDSVKSGHYVTFVRVNNSSSSTEAHTWYYCDCSLENNVVQRVNFADVRSPAAALNLDVCFLLYQRRDCSQFYQFLQSTSDLVGLGRESGTGSSADEAINLASTSTSTAGSESKSTSNTEGVVTQGSTRGADSRAMGNTVEKDAANPSALQLQEAAAPVPSQESLQLPMNQPIEYVPAHAVTLTGGAGAGAGTGANDGGAGCVATDTSGSLGLNDMAATVPDNYNFQPDIDDTPGPESTSAGDPLLPMPAAGGSDDVVLVVATSEQGTAHAPAAAANAHPATTRIAMDPGVHVRTSTGPPRPSPETNLGGPCLCPAARRLAEVLDAGSADLATVRTGLWKLLDESDAQLNQARYDLIAADEKARVVADHHKQEVEEMTNHIHAVHQHCQRLEQHCQLLGARINAYESELEQKAAELEALAIAAPHAGIRRSISDVDRHAQAPAPAQALKRPRHGHVHCEHGRERRRCKECGGSQICAHGRRKNMCKEGDCV